MNKYTLLAMAMAGVLTGCGGGSTDSTKKHYDPSTNQPTSDDHSLIKAWPISEVADKVTKQVITQTSPQDLCGTDRTDLVIETADFRATFGEKSTRFNSQELEQAARLTQVALEELLAHTGLSKTNDLGIADTTKWTICYNDNQSGNGTGFARKFEFSPKTLSPANAEFQDAYELAKHELFHVIQFALLNEEQIYHHLPYWFQEASAELFAGKNTSELSPLTLKNFVADTNQSPYSVTTWNNEQTILKNSGGTLVDGSYQGGKYGNQSYQIYLASLEYLFAKGMDKAQLLQLTKESYSSTNVNSFVNFDASIARLENDLNLPTTYPNLKNKIADYSTHIIEEWMKSDNHYSAAYFDDIEQPMKELYLYSVDGKTEVAKAAINSAQDQYTFSGPLSDGKYQVYVGTVQDIIYGPLTHSVNNGELGDINFSGVAICSACND